MSAPPAPPPRRQHLEALLLALLCAALFLGDALRPGRALVPYPPEQMDVVRAEALAAGAFDPADARRGNSSGGDKYLQSLCWDRVLRDRLRAGELPRWTRDIGGGAPFVPQMAQVYQPINLLLLWLPAEQWYGPWWLLHAGLFGYFAWRFLRQLGCRQPAALLGLVAAVLGLWTQCKLHHNVILTAALPLWPMLGAVHALLHERVRGAAARRQVAWLALWTGLGWSSGFAVVALQVSYLGAGYAALLLAAAPRGERLRPGAAVLAGLGLGGALSLAHMLPVLQAAAVSARDGGWNPGFLAAHGLEWDHALGLLWPDLLAWAADRFYADPQQPLADVTRLPWSQLVLLQQPLSPVTGNPFQSWVETSFAVGTLPLGCAALALHGWRRAAGPQRAAIGYFAIAGLLGFALATADEPLLSLCRWLPGVASADLRRLLFVPAMALVVLAGLGADRLHDGAPRWPLHAVLGLAAAGGALLLGFVLLHRDEAAFVDAVAGLLAADHDHPQVQAVHGDRAAIAAWIRGAMQPGEALANQQQLLQTALRALLAAGLGALLLRGRGAPARWRSLVLLGLTIGELLHAGRGFAQTVPAERVATPPRVVAPVQAASAAATDGVRPRLARLAGPTEARIAAWYPANLPGYHGLEDASGYNPLPARRYEEFFRAIEPPRGDKADVAFGGAGVGAFHDPASLQHPLCDLFGVQFVLTRADLGSTPGLVDRTPAGSGGYRLYERTTALPRAIYVRDVEVLPDPAARLAALADPQRNVRQRLVLEDPAAPRPAPAATNLPPPLVQITAHTDERVVVQMVAPADGYLRLADPYDAGWRATVDGAPTTLYAADHYLRAVHVPAGAHEVVFTYDAPRVVWPLRLSLLALFGVAALAAWPARRRA